MVAEYDIHRKSYKYGPEDWQLLVNVLHEHSEKLVVLSNQLLKEKNDYKFRKIISPFFELLLTIFIIAVFLVGGTLISVNVNINNLPQALTISAVCLPSIIILIVSLLTSMSRSRYKRLTLKQLEKDARVLASRLESALRLMVSVADQVEISLAKKLEMDLYIDESSSALEYYYLTADSKNKYRNTKDREIIEPFSNAIDRLESKSMKTRLSGIYALEQISIDLPDKYYIAVVESLSAFIRDKSPVNNAAEIGNIKFDFYRSIEKRLKKYNKNLVGFFKFFFGLNIPEDVNTALNVLRRRNISEENSSIKIDLRRVNLAGANIKGFDFRSANLRDCNFSHANLQGIDFSHADLRGVDFSKAKIRDSIFGEADLNGANFTSSTLSHCSFNGANLNAVNFLDTDFNDVWIDKDNFKGVDLNAYQLSAINFSCRQNSIN